MILRSTYPKRGVVPKLQPRVVRFLESVCLVSAVRWWYRPCEGARERPQVRVGPMGSA